MTVETRLETSQSEKVAKEIIERLPKNESEIERMIQTGYSLAKDMSWDAAVENYLLKNLLKEPQKVRR